MMRMPSGQLAEVLGRPERPGQAAPAATGRPWVLTYPQEPASGGGSMPRSRGEIVAAAQAAATRAHARGAISEARVRYWTQLAEAGEDVAPVLDQLTATRPPPGGQVAAAAPPPGAGPLYAANPILDEMRAARPALVAAAMADDPSPPRLFGDTDLPPFTASGLDPQVLASLPWPLRRPAAAMAKLSAVYALVEKYTGEAAPMSVVDLGTAGENAAYVAAMSLWLQGNGGGPADRGPQDQPRNRAGQYAAASGDYTTESLHAELFGATGYAPPRPAVPERKFT
jgi:hypothetical protein